MERLSLRDIQKIELRMLKQFDLFCKENNLLYSLAGGTLIGAVRHNGFIPWDDDIDIYMLREEYNRLIDVIERGKHLQCTKYKFILPEKGKTLYPFIKVIDEETVVYENNIDPKYSIGVWLDIFPIDYCAETEEEAEKVCMEMNRNIIIYLRYYLKYSNDNLINRFKNIYIKLIKTFKQKKLHIVSDAIFGYGNNQKSKYAGTLVWALNRRDVYPTKMFEGYTELQFEDQKFMVFEKYHEILIHRFGNYMEIPSEDKRMNHSPEAYKI